MISSLFRSKQRMTPSTPWTSMMEMIKNHCRETPARNKTSNLSNTQTSRCSAFMSQTEAQTTSKTRGTTRLYPWTALNCTISGRSSRLLKIRPLCMIISSSHNNNSHTKASSKTKGNLFQRWPWTNRLTCRGKIQRTESIWILMILNWLRTP